MPCNWITSSQSKYDERLAGQVAHPFASSALAGLDFPPSPKEAIPPTLSCALRASASPRQIASLFRSAPPKASPFGRWSGSDCQDWYPEVRKDRHTMNPLLNRISVDPNVCFGKPCVRGTRVWVSLLLDFLASGMTMEQILEEYPQLTRDDILAA